MDVEMATWNRHVSFGRTNTTTARFIYGMALGVLGVGGAYREGRARHEYWDVFACKRARRHVYGQAFTVVRMSCSMSTLLLKPPSGVSFLNSVPA